ncbi:MAG: fructose-bisphosphatase class II, partial [Bacteroidota bacterium]
APSHLASAPVPVLYLPPATGITSSSFLQGVNFKAGNIATTQSIVMRSYSGTIRYIDGIHQLDKKMKRVNFDIMR